MTLPGMALAFLAGIVCVETQEALTAAALRTSPLITIAVVLALIRPSCIALLLAGTGWAAWSATNVMAGELEISLEGRDIVAMGEVVSLPERSEHQVQFDFAPAMAKLGPGDPAAGSRVRLPPRVRLNWYGAEHAPGAGERWQLEVRLRNRRGFANPGGFDYEGQLYRERIGALGYVRTSSDNRLLDGGTLQPILVLREGIVAAVSDRLAASQARGVLIGLAVGDTSGITADAWRVFSRTGTTHLVAISGLHVTMVAALVMGCVRTAWRVWPGPLRGTRHDMAIICGVLAAIAYSLLAGFSVPTQRTLAMLVAASCAGFLRRSAPASVILSLALIAVLLIDPHAVLAAGFWLSFLAVAGILMVVRPGRGAGSETRNFFRAQGAVTLLLLPATLVLFGSVSLLAPVANLLAVPVFTLILVPATLLGVACLGVVPAAGDAMLRFAALTFEWTWPALERMAAAHAALVFPLPPSPLLLIALTLSAIVMLTVLVGRLKLLPIVLLVPLFLAKPARLGVGTFEVTVMDVGQGLSVLVRTATHTLVYDAGPGFRSGRSAGELVVVPLLRQHAIRRIDRFVISHDDSDHAGGAAAVAREVAVGSWRYGSGKPGRGSRCVRGEAWTWDEVRFEFLHPGGNRETWGEDTGGENDNDDSCVLRVSSGAGSLLIAGDIERRAEEWLVSRSLVQPVDVVVMPHHGSRTSSSPAFVDATRARVAIVSTGYRNRWGFPHPDVVARWCEAGAEVIDTSNWGAVSVLVAGGLQPPRGHRALHRRYWHARADQPPRTLCYDRHDQRKHAGRAPNRVAVKDVGDFPQGRSLHVAAAPLLDRCRRNPARAAVDTAAQARNSSRTDRAGVEMAQREPGQ